LSAYLGGAVGTGFLVSTRQTDPRVESMKLQLAETAEKFAATEDAIADTLETSAAVGSTEHRERRRESAARARAEAERERIEAEKWRTVYAQEQAEGRDSDN
jgi:hypothetical protein